MHSKIYISTYDDIHNPHYGGGGAIAVHEVAKRLSKKYDLTVITWDYCGIKYELIDGVPYERFGLPFLSPKIAMFAYQIGLPFIVMTKKYDLWIESFCPPFTTSLLPFYTKNPVVGIVHMLAAEDMERKYKLPFHIIQNFGIKNYKYIIVTSEALHKKIKKINSSTSVSVISNGVKAVYKPIIKKEKYILFLGRIEINQKGLDMLISAFKISKSLRNGFKLIIAGDGDSKEVEQLKVLIHKAGINKDVILKGRVKGVQKIKLIQNAACVVIPSRFETYSLVALEAMAYGAPIVSFNLEGLSWIPSQAAKKVKSYDINAFSTVIDEVSLNKKNANVLIKNGNAYAKHFTWDVITKQYSEYIQKII